MAFRHLLHRKEWQVLTLAKPDLWDTMKFVIHSRGRNGLSSGTRIIWHLMLTKKDNGSDMMIRKVLRSKRDSLYRWDWEVL